jgi:hypothetical protein
MNERSIFLHALDIADAAARSAYLDQACGGDAQLRQQVEALLQSHESAGPFLQEPALAQLAPVAAPVSPEVTLAHGPADNPIDDLPFLAPSTNPAHLGRLGRYEILGVIGKGGFGVVLKGFDENLRRVVAIKVLAPAYANSAAARKRFIREARAAAAVKNEHVVAIHDVQADEQPPYLVMELIDGISLQDKLDKHGPLAVPEILRIGMQMAEGLAAAHKQGLVHRDIKPANILLENGVERVKITDFGLARAVDDASVTQSGVVAGTPMYMSPEQAEGLPIDHRSDLFSLGTVLYTMCTGHPPFRATGTHAVLKRVIDAVPRPIREINSDIPDWLCDIIAKLHAKKPQERFQTAQEVAELLGQHLAHLQQPHAAPKPAPLTIPASSPASPARAERIGWFKPVLHSGGYLPVLIVAAYSLIVLLEVSLGESESTLHFGAAVVAAVLLVGAEALARRYHSQRLRGLVIALGCMAVGGALIGYLKLPATGVVLLAANDPDTRITLTRPGTGPSFELAPADEMRIPIGIYRLEVRCGAGRALEYVEIHDWGNQTKFFGGRSEHEVHLQLERGQIVKITVQVVPLKAQAVDIAGHWQEEPEWGNVHLVARGDGYEGTYSATFNKQPGSITLTRVGPSTFRGVWSESDRQFHGVFTLEAAKDGQTLHVAWESRDNRPGGPRKDESVWTKVKEPATPNAWVPLLSGTDLSGWQESPVQNNWKVVNSWLVGSPATGAFSYLVTNKSDFQDFHLHTEARINNGGRAEVLLRMQDKPGVGYRVSVNLDKDPQRTGSLYQLMAFPEDLIKADEWFPLDVILRGNQILVQVNGTTTVKYTDVKQQFQRGRLALMIEPPGQVHFRKIEIKELPSKVPPTAAGEGEFIDKLGDCKIERKAGQVTLTVPAGQHDIGPKGLITAPLLLQPVEGDFDVQVKALPAAPREGNCYAALLAMNGMSDLIAINRQQMFDAKTQQVFTRSFRFADGTADITLPKLLTDVPAHLPLYLRLVRRGNQVNTLFSKDGVMWTNPLSHDVDWPQRVRVGLAAVNVGPNEFRAVFDEFKLAPERSD